MNHLDISNTLYRRMHEAVFCDIAAYSALRAVSQFAAAGLGAKRPLPPNAIGRSMTFSQWMRAQTRNGGKQLFVIRSAQQRKKES